MFLPGRSMHAEANGCTLVPSQQENIQQRGQGSSMIGPSRHGTWSLDERNGEIIVLWTRSPWPVRCAHLATGRDGSLVFVPVGPTEMPVAGLVPARVAWRAVAAEGLLKLNALHVSKSYVYGSSNVEAPMVYKMLGCMRYGGGDGAACSGIDQANIKQTFHPAYTPSFLGLDISHPISDLLEGLGEATLPLMLLELAKQNSKLFKYNEEEEGVGLHLKTMFYAK
ncbi:hypothetical protein DKX38_004897 [Salix brachista]|uniref:Uncharacterized protein n=1 Tax=Salix brachista TaxID=2182728 RepID=A0A5N5NDX2_9ROSI|nr:hypothetical protein DKX38_004897 [Salix brachista]